MADNLEGMVRVSAVNWTEYEFGQRDDGFSLHLNVEDAEAYKRENTTQQFRPEGGVFFVIVAQTVYEQLVANKENNGLGIARAFPKKVSAGEIVELR